MILCWADAGPAFGLGHVCRGLALAEALAERGVSCRFVLPHDPTAAAWLAAAGVAPAIPLPDDQPALPWVLDAARGAAAVVVDVKHPLTCAEVRALGGDRRVLVIDNAGPGVDAADLVLAPFGTARDRRWLTGPHYVPLRAGYRASSPPPPRADDTPVVLVSMGAADPGGLSVPALAALARVRSRLEARVVANPLAAVWARLPDLLRALGFPPAHPVDPAGMQPHLAAADVAVLALGVTVYEAMASGVPAVVLCRTDADVAHARTLADAGAIVSLGLHWTEERIAAAVERLLADPVARVAMSRAGRALVDGRGAARVAARLVAEGEEHAGEHLHA